MQAEGDQLQAAPVRQVRVRGPYEGTVAVVRAEYPLPDRQGALMERLAVSSSPWPPSTGTQPG